MVFSTNATPNALPFDFFSAFSMKLLSVPWQVAATITSPEKPRNVSSSSSFFHGANAGSYFRSSDQGNGVIPLLFTWQWVLIAPGGISNVGLTGLGLGSIFFARAGAFLRGLSL